MWEMIGMALIAGLAATGVFSLVLGVWLQGTIRELIEDRRRLEWLYRRYACFFLEKDEGGDTLLWTISGSGKEGFWIAKVVRGQFRKAIDEGRAHG